MTAFSAFYPFIVPDMPGCPEPGINLELARVSNDFCSQGWIYRTEVEEFIISGDESVSLSLPPGTQLVGIVSALKDDSSEFYAFTLDGDDMILDETAIYDFDLTLVVALKKPMTATDVPDVLFRDHLDAVVAGVKSRLFASPKKSWSDSDLASYYGLIYRQELSRYTTKAFRDWSHGNIARNTLRFV